MEGNKDKPETKRKGMCQVNVGKFFPTEKEDILCIVKFFTFSAGLDRLQLTC